MNDKEEDLKSLVNQVKADNKEAFGKLYDATIGDVYKNVYFLLSNKDGVDDLVQEIYMGVYRSLRKFNGDQPFTPWLIGIAVNQVKSFRRKNWVYERLSRKVAENERNKEKVAEIITGIENDFLYQTIEELPFKLKQVIILRYVNEYSQEEVAAILHIPIGTVKSRIHAALKKLRMSGEKQKILMRRVGDLS
ncbi:sigma-70 family RNA polymerase sigma factor [Rossellomorea aquimaris]|uniref:sigma-70 family RNA polymerase sigma factor n=1 Tax=Rossellomorea aquimaris TaxID=189382 RepID=UPI001CD1D0E8|nr:sigma-70 family RNA polymerase sigma factor [Rossellomorea aquimaris]MCA1060679.1 sigma-70 family RNA polymerase sigma factor [Rossellomorea aquimaris]